LEFITTCLSGDKIGFDESRRALEIDKHLEPDCLIVYVRQQREKHVGRVKQHLKTELGCRDVIIGWAMRTQEWQTATETNWWKTLNTVRSKLRKLAWDSSFLRRCLGYVDYEFLKTAEQPNE